MKTPDSRRLPGGPVYRYLVLRSNPVRKRTDGVRHWGQHGILYEENPVDDLSTCVRSEGHYLVVPLDEDRRPREFKARAGQLVVEAV